MANLILLILKLIFQRWRGNDCLYFKVVRLRIGKGLLKVNSLASLSGNYICHSLPNIRGMICHAL